MDKNKQSFSSNKDTLPKVEKKRKIDVSKFDKLARRVRKYLEEEENYLKKKDENSNSSRLLSNS